MDGAVCSRGSQLLGHFSFMFAAGLKGPLNIAAIGIYWTSWWTISAGLSDHEAYLVWMRIYAAIYGFMEFDPAKQVALETGLGGTIQLPIIMLDAYPPVIRAWDHLIDLLGDALVRSALLLVPAFVLLKESLTILLEGAPEGVDVDEVGRTMLAVPGVTGGLDLHVWMLTSSKNALTAHVIRALARALRPDPRRAAGVRSPRPRCHAQRARRGALVSLAPRRPRAGFPRQARGAPRHHPRVGA